MSRAADAIAAGDVVNVRVRRYQQWGHMPFSAFNSTVLPATYLHGRRETLAPVSREVWNPIRTALPRSRNEGVKSHLGGIANRSWQFFDSGKYATTFSSFHTSQKLFLRALNACEAVTHSQHRKNECKKVYPCPLSTFSEVAQCRKHTD